MTELRMVTPAGEQLDETRAVLVQALRERGYEVDLMASTADLARQLAAGGRTSGQGQPVWQSPTVGVVTQANNGSLWRVGGNWAPLDALPEDAVRLVPRIAEVPPEPDPSTERCEHPEPALDEVQVDRCWCGALVDAAGRVYRQELGRPGTTP